ncbi:hypothetical protein BT96DRAFT_150347 [Gymnopus androsaceus JB14]|uniref:Uncharacterized protein n=1 Tax=Gymnopus androsaceus JB14 TaxID=1447944 RepID=A0A6A4I945_9AGAR|nr:hypothetical protein BT96DRAFT_150347 [Gymnopus androsaceus JB14]
MPYYSESSADPTKGSLLFMESSTSGLSGEGPLSNSVSIPYMGNDISSNDSAFYSSSNFDARQPSPLVDFSTITTDFGPAQTIPGDDPSLQYIGYDYLSPYSTTTRGGERHTSLSEYHALGNNVEYPTQVMPPALSAPPSSFAAPGTGYGQPLDGGDPFLHQSMAYYTYPRAPWIRDSGGRIHSASSALPYSSYEALDNSCLNLNTYNDSSAFFDASSYFPTSEIDAAFLEPAANEYYAHIHRSL